MASRHFQMYKSGRLSKTYMNCVLDFIKAVEAHRRNVGDERIWCPCYDCKNFQRFEDAKDIEYHLISSGFVPHYECWTKHGESFDSATTYCTNNENNDNLDDKFTHSNDIYNDMFGLFGDDMFTSSINDNVGDNLNDMFADLDNDTEEGDSEKLKRLFEDSKKPLYDGCNDYTKLSATLNLFKLKAKHKWSDTSFDDLLDLLHKMLPTENELPTSNYEAKKLMCPMGLEVERIHACPNDCMLYRNEFENIHTCVTCGESRYLRKSQTGAYNNDVMKNGPPAKVVWYFPIIPRLKRFFANEKEAKLLRWHSEVVNDEGKMRHVSDSPQWMRIDAKYPEFGNEVRNIRFGLSSDGINPFGNMSSRHSTWPVLLCIYNLPPWLCMKQKYMMMSLLIQGPKQPGNNIDVYLSPLIDDLKTLWNTGVTVFDAYKKEYFRLRAMIFCTISDFPAYANLSGYSTKGKLACPVCEDDTCSIRLKNCKKTVYMGHRRFLPKGHRFRKDKERFNGSTEMRTVRKNFDAFSRVKDIKTILGKRSRDERDTGNWRKRSIFWDLPYWRDLKVRHCLDVMHIEKNVCDSLLGLLLDLPGKTKDGINARNDMLELGIREKLAPQKKGDRWFLPPACYTMSTAEKTQFLKCLHDIKVPSSYSANIKRLVSMKDLKLVGMKSHDCHVLMTHMIPIALRGLLPESTRHTITKLCLFFIQIHSKVIVGEDLYRWQKEIIITLCELEMYFPPSFFDVMVHLVIHIVDEISNCGPVFLRYMYPFERYMGLLKGYVRNRSRPEGSIVRGYATHEVTEFCTGYLGCDESIGVPKSRHTGKLQGAGGVGSKMIPPPQETLELAHFCVLKHMTCIAPYVNEHMTLLKSTNPSRDIMWLQVKHNREFSSWLRNKVKTLDADATVLELGRGPEFRVSSYQGYDINGYTFYTKEQDAKSTMQNSGVSVIASTTKYDRANRNILLDVATDSYYGVIQEIWELSYRTFTVPVFRCKWVNQKTGVRVDKYGFTLVDLSTNGYPDDPFVLASHCTQVFYVKDPSKTRYHIVMQGKRHILGVDNVVSEEEYDHFDDLPPFSIGIEDINVATKGDTYLRSDHSEGIYVDPPIQTQ